MKQIKKLSIFAAMALAVTMCATSAMAQTNFQGGVHFNTGFPQGELKDEVDRNAYGIGGQIFYAPSKSPVAIGLEFGWLNYGSETRQEPFSMTVPDVTVDVTTQNNIVQGFFVLRGRMPRGPIQLYGDALVGFNYMYTETSISDDGNMFDDIASTVNQDDFAFAYGFGGGIMVPVFTRKVAKDGGKPLQVCLDGGLRYVMGGEADYLTENSIVRDGLDVTYNSVTSKTDLMRLHLGVSVKF